MLTQLAITAAKPRTNRTNCPTAPAFRSVETSGETWRFRYHFIARRMLSFGSYPDVTLAQARAAFFAPQTPRTFTGSHSSKINASARTTTS